MASHPTGSPFAKGPHQGTNMAGQPTTHHAPPTPIGSFPSVNDPLMTASMVEQAVLADYGPPGSFHHSPKRPLPPPPHLAKPVQFVYNPCDGTLLRDHNGRAVTVGRLLATAPLRHEILTRPGPGGKKLTYVSGESITRTLNDIFGFDGWDLSITRTQREECLKDEKSGKYTVCYTAQVRLTHKLSGAYREDCGAGDATDRSFGTAAAHSLKASITDALKRAARHFGDKCGNSLYQGKFNINKAPKTLQEALDMYDIDRANTKFGFGSNGMACMASPTTHPATGRVPSTVNTAMAAASSTLPTVAQNVTSKMPQANNFNAVPPPPKASVPPQHNITVTNATLPRPKSSYGPPQASSNPPTHFPVDDVSRRVSVDSVDATSGPNQPLPPPPVAAPKDFLEHKNSTANTYPKRLQLHTLPTDVGKHGSSTTSIPASAAEASTAPAAIHPASVQHNASFKRNAGMMSNPYSQHQSYPNKGSRSSI